MKPTRSDVTIARGDGLVFAEVDGEAVALNAARGLCYGLDGVGLRLLQLIEQPATLTELCSRLIAEYDVDPETCERDLRDLIDDLVAEGLVVIQSDTHAG